MKPCPAARGRFVTVRRAACMAVCAATASAAFAQMSYLDNGVIKIGVNLGKGGSITYLSDSGTGQNIVNSADLGRQIQQSYYSGPDDFDPYGNQSPNWNPWPWNPIQSGDCYGHRGTVLQSNNDGTELYVKSRPMQWALNGVPGEATFESWIRLEGPAARIRARLVNARTDSTLLYPARHQELPAVYTVGTLHRLFTYQGTAPWSGGPLTDKGHVPPPWTYWRATENWAALVNDAGWGRAATLPGAAGLHDASTAPGVPGGHWSRSAATLPRCRPTTSITTSSMSTSTAWSSAGWRTFAPGSTNSRAARAPNTCSTPTGNTGSAETRVTPAFRWKG